ncbi:hypothetical protein B0H17DRAFT_1153303 [Mycena rosella]|uniref:Uncharacterized protein n=1 Tax=Mycena rosella TaxID=1033263 RepID=A0AAD7B7A6_MYCRO|nr:hypothetical protein B0H17DRAFT_1153303 [Mycena rosella]
MSLLPKRIIGKKKQIKEKNMKEHEEEVVWLQYTCKILRSDGYHIWTQDFCVEHRVVGKADRHEHPARAQICDCEAAAGARDDDPVAGAGVAVLDHAVSPADLGRKPAGMGVMWSTYEMTLYVYVSAVLPPTNGSLPVHDLDEALPRGELGWDLTGCMPVSRRPRRWRGWRLKGPRHLNHTFEAWSSMN